LQKGKLLRVYNLNKFLPQLLTTNRELTENQLATGNIGAK